MMVYGKKQNLRIFMIQINADVLCKFSLKALNARQIGSKSKVVWDEVCAGGNMLVKHTKLFTRDTKP